MVTEIVGGSVDFSFECIGSVDVMRAALECCHKGWGEGVIIGVAGARQEIRTRLFQLVTGRVWCGSAFGGVKGRTQLPGMVEDAMSGKINLDPFVMHTMPLEQINEAFELLLDGKSIRTASISDYRREILTVYISIHPSVDQGVAKGSVGFFWGGLRCRCANDSVEIKVGDQVAFSHACGCTQCWKPVGTLFSVVGVVPSVKLTVVACGEKLQVVDENALIQRYACTARGSHLYGRIENKAHAIYGLDFIHTELSNDVG